LLELVVQEPQSLSRPYDHRLEAPRRPTELQVSIIRATLASEVLVALSTAGG
jgi:hypothetical protein